MNAHSADYDAGRRAAFWAGTRLGIFRAWATVGPIGAVILFATDHLWLAGMLTVGSVLGWLGLRDTRPTSPGVGA